MPGFLLHHTHKPEDCGWAFHDLETSSHLPPGTTFFARVTAVTTARISKLRLLPHEQPLIFCRRV